MILESNIIAIDSINIIDSDLAHDIYIGITDDWKEGKAFDEILQEVLTLETSFCGDDEIPQVFREIYWTALAYSLWKIGHLPDDIYQTVSITSFSTHYKLLILCRGKKIFARTKFNYLNHINTL